MALLFALAVVAGAMLEFERVAEAILSDNE
jgi:hypothetical protein